MTEEMFRHALDEATETARAFATRYVTNDLSGLARYRVLLNQSCDGHPLKPDETIFPEDSQKDPSSLQQLSHEQVVQLLVRGERVPEWIDISVRSADSQTVTFELLCCGRFTASDALLYYPGSNCRPFGIKSPVLPYGWTDAEGRFNLNSGL